MENTLIGKLRGTVDEIDGDSCVMDVNGVGYVAFCTSPTITALQAVEGEVTLYVETVVREDMIRLYGFLKPIERQWFRLLQDYVQGVGAKVALSVLSTLAPDELARAILSKDAVAIAKTPGVGKKVAERIIAELQNKVPAGCGGESPSPITAMPAGKAAEEAVSALLNLGYRKDKAMDSVAAALKAAGADADVATLIGLGLKAASR